MKSFQFEDGSLTVIRGGYLHNYNIYSLQDDRYDSSFSFTECTDNHETSLLS